MYRCTDSEIYDNFLNDYDGKSIYMGPTPDSKPQGGHAIRIVGWDKTGDIEYWVVANSWGSSWGRNGYFHMKMGIPECQLEKNVYGLIPDIPGINIINNNIPLHVTSEDILERSKIKIDVSTGYKLTAITKLREGLLRGSFRELYNTKYMPDFETFVAGSEMRIHPIYTDFPISPYFVNISQPQSLTESQSLSTPKAKDEGKNNLVILFLIFTISILVTFIFIKTKKILVHSYIKNKK